MSIKYDSFIELTPGYESVVDISSDSNDAGFWSRYIVNDDMVTAVDLLAKSLRPDNVNEDVKHYWIKGPYGTGKTYSAIVIKHLLQDDYNVVENFLSKNPLFFEVKDKFLSVRKKGPYYVKFRSGECKQLDTSNKFLFQIENSVREILRENGFKYTGRNSLIGAVQEAVKKFRPTLSQQFEEEAFPKYWSKYNNFEDFYNLVMSGDVSVCANAQEILQSMNIGLATDLETFKKWLKDVYAGNSGLSKTGIFIIWDEFSEYIKANDLDIIQQLSLFSKELPFFVIYIMHEYPGAFSENISKGLGKADSRFHKIDISLKEQTTLRLIGESIITRDGMKDNWAEICDELYSSISGSVHSFMGDPDSELDAVALKKIFPIHPMTVNLVSKVAGLAASNRSIFAFLKSSGDDGFRAYIRNNGLDEWKWVTPDYLWDYFFVNNLGGKKYLNKTAEDALKHYNKLKNQISDDKILRVFKVAMLLLATVGSGHSLKKTKSGRGIQATEKTICDCFAGMLDKSTVSEYLRILSSELLNALTLAPDIFEGARIELPYSGSGDELGDEINRIKEVNPPSKLLDKDSYFGSVLKKQFVPEERAVVKRLEVDTCWGQTQQINNKFKALEKSIEKTYHKFGLLIIAVPMIDEIEKVKTTVGALINEDDTKRMLVCILRHPLPIDMLNTWYELVANGSLAQKSGNSVNADSYKNQASDLVGTWVGAVIGKDMDLLYGNTSSHIHMNKGVISGYEKIVFKVFPAAPENIIKKITLYKSVAVAPAYYGVSKTTLNSKNSANDRQKNFNQQWQDCVDVLKDNEENVWDCSTAEEVMAFEKTKVGRSMAALCSAVNKALTSGTVVLTDFWDDLQKELGYYDTGVCCYLLGFALHFYIGKYTWFDGNNSHKLDEETIPQIIVSMLNGKAAGMKLSSESEIEKRFKDITERIFGLSEDEAGDIYDCRKNVKIRITKSGYPIWAIKYLDEGEFSGIKDEISEITDKYVDYILEFGNPSDVIEELVGLVKAKPKIYIQTLKAILSDKAKLAAGMKNFICKKAPDTWAACEKYGFTVATLFKMLNSILEEEKWQWREQEVEQAAHRLALDLTLVGVVNEALDGSAESVEKVKDTLSNYLSYIYIPGCIYASLNESWSETVATLHDLSENAWLNYSDDKKIAVINDLKIHMAEAIENIAHPTAVLKSYIEKSSMGSFSDSEYNDILHKMRKESFGQTEHSFKSGVEKIIRELDYSKKVRKLLSVWKSKVGVESVSAWNAKYIMPVVWAMPEREKLFSVISALEKNERIDDIRLENAMIEVSNADFSVLSDNEEIDRRFIINVSSEKFLGLLIPHVKDLKNKIQNSGYRDYSRWNNDLVSIRPIVEKFISSDLRAEVSDKAKKRLKDYNDMDRLKRDLERILEKSSEACLLLLNEE